MTRERHDFTLAGKAFAREVMKHEKPKPSLAKSFGWVCAGLCMQVIFGVVGMLLWNWFIPVIFTTLPKINLAEAMGISLVTHYLTGRSDLLREKDMAEVLSNGLASAIAFLLMGFIIKQFI